MLKPELADFVPLNEDFSKLHTKQLLKRLANVRRGMCLAMSCGWEGEEIPDFIEYYHKVKKELSTRPHVPNKREARLIRQHKALAGS